MEWNSRFKNRNGMEQLNETIRTEQKEQSLRERNSVKQKPFTKKKHEKKHTKETSKMKQVKHAFQGGKYELIISRKESMEQLLRGDTWNQQ